MADAQRGQFGIETDASAVLGDGALHLVNQRGQLACRSSPRIKRRELGNRGLGGIELVEDRLQARVGVALLR